MHCWKCGLSLEELRSGKISFREVCDNCHAYLHCCRNCRYYKPGLPNDCAIPGTETISDREAMNFCEEFQLMGQGPSKQIDPKEIEKRLFGD